MYMRGNSRRTFMFYIVNVNNKSYLDIPRYCMPVFQSHHPHNRRHSRLVSGCYNFGCAFEHCHRKRHRMQTNRSIRSKHRLLKTKMKRLLHACLCWIKELLVNFKSKKHLMLRNSKISTWVVSNTYLSCVHKILLWTRPSIGIHSYSLHLQSQRRWNRLDRNALHTVPGQSHSFDH